MCNRRLGIFIQCIVAVLLMGAANTLADPIFFYEDFHTMDWTPVNPEVCPEFTVDIESPGFLYMTDHVLTCGEADMFFEKPLCRPIGIMEDITVSFKIQALDDVYMGMGGTMLIGFNDEDEQVFRLHWADVQGATGSGFLSFRAEDEVLYFSPNFPTINDVLELRRSGDRWTAWLGDTQLGETLIHEPTRECTKLWVSFYNQPDYSARNDVKIDYIAIHTAMGGDANGDGSTNVGDAVYLINRVFKGGPLPIETDDAGCPE